MHCAADKRMEVSIHIFFYLEEVLHKPNKVYNCEIT